MTDEAVKSLDDIRLMATPDFEGVTGCSVNGSDDLGVTLNRAQLLLLAGMKPRERPGNDDLGPYAELVGLGVLKRVCGSYDPTEAARGAKYTILY